MSEDRPKCEQCGDHNTPLSLTLISRTEREETALLCTECSIRFVRAAPARKLILMISALPAERKAEWDARQLTIETAPTDPAPTDPAPTGMPITLPQTELMPGSPFGSDPDPQP